jgi:CDP-diacylglycerol--serine O-phosphatidyltransferase
MAMLRVSERYSALRFINELTRKVSWYSIALTIIAALYVLAALIRLAYFNATEEERAEEMAKTGSMHYTGLPVTSAALIFPFVVLVHFFTKFDFSLLYFFVLLLVGILFVCPFKLKKLGGKALYVLVAICIIEFILLIWFKWRH